MQNESVCLVRVYIFKVRVVALEYAFRECLCVCNICV